MGDNSAKLDSRKTVKKYIYKKTLNKKSTRFLQKTTKSKQKTTENLQKVKDKGTQITILGTME